MTGAGFIDDELEEELRTLAELVPIEYDRRRDQAAKDLGIRVRTLDAEVADRRPKGGAADGVSGEHVLFEPIEPWADPVDGDELLSDLVAAIERYVVLDTHAATAIALWVLHAHAHDAAWISPILAFASPEKRCGKTTALALLQRLVPLALPAANITSAALFRAAEKWQPTLLVDEADSFLKDNEELRGILNSGHNRAAAQVIRTVGEDHEPRAFKTWAPKAIALIGALPGTLEDRSIVIQMRRRRSDEKVSRLRGDRDHGFLDLARRCTRWVADHGSAIRERDPDLPAGQNDRACDNWRPLVAIADEVGGDWPARTREAALALSSSEDDEASSGVRLLADIRVVFEVRGDERLASKALAEALAELDDRPWGEWRRGKPITTHGLARVLKAFAIQPKTLRVGLTTIKGYDVGWFKDAFARYLPSTPDPTVTPSQLNENNDLATEQTVTRSDGVTVRETEKLNETGQCYGVTVGIGVAAEVDPPASVAETRLEEGVL